MGKFTVMDPVHHDGKRYEVGETIVLDADAATALLEVGAVEDVRESAAARKARAKAEAEAEAARIAAEEAAAAEAAAAAQAQATQGGNAPT